MGLFNKFKQGAEDLVKGYDKVKLNKKLTYEELLEIMQDGSYPCGKPDITGKGIMKCIRFPAVDKYLIQVAVTGKTITISKIYSGTEGFVKEVAGDLATDGWYSAVNGENIDLNRMTRSIGEELSKLLKAKGLLKE
ncbi:hypothetical protein [Vallitalea maricola]|uniref:Uncharacterized protein n=1 Tax=Vallitalea maricola TaxID=3074433 RepID=A0ACB5UGB5_9FIRM|nr:hypothetical protein AN2V17_12140 [Vallitalea sp. AN17-2]